MTPELRPFNDDPVARRNLAERQARLDARMLKVIVDGAPVVAQLQALGHNVDRIAQLGQNGEPLDDTTVQVLLSGLTMCHELKNLEYIARNLLFATARFDGRPLIECMDRVKDPNLTFAIVNTLVLRHPHSIDDWWQGAQSDQYLSELLKNLRHKWGTENYFRPYVKKVPKVPGKGKGDAVHWLKGKGDAAQ